MIVAIIIFGLLLIIVVVNARRREPPEIPEEMPTSDRLTLADELQKLLDLPLTSHTETEAWYQACHEAQKRLGSCRVWLPHYVYHWFSDADIRFKEPGYRDKQDSEIRDLISRYRGGAASASHANT